MRSRGLVVALALLLAIGATAAVFLYVNGVREEARTGGDLIQVVVATQDIQANAELGPLVEAGIFTTAGVPADTVVADAVTDPQQLVGQTSTFPILANEQIPLSRISSGEQIAGGSLGITPGHVGATFRVDGPSGVGGHIVRGDNVVVYATFSGVKIFKSYKELIKDATSSSTAPSQSPETLPALTVTLVPTVKVLDIENPVETTDGKTSEGQITITLDMLPEDAANTVHAAEQGSLWFGLLPPDEEGVQLPAATVPLDKVLGKKA